MVSMLTRLVANGVTRLCYPDASASPPNRCLRMCEDGAVATRYRITGHAGTHLATRSPGYSRCGTRGVGWLSGCSLTNASPHCSTPGRYPAVSVRLLT
eukprot:COSAG01_NODE_3840_length_5646_cov_13.756805_6_plen_98_part_00